MPKIVDHDQYRKELLSKCFNLFAEKGYSSITMRQIAQGLGVSTGTLYHYFPSKETLFWQLVEELTQQDILTFLAEASSAASLPERIKALIDFIAKYEDYFRKQFLIWIDFYQRHDRAEFLQNEILQKSNMQTRQTIADYLQISDRAVVDFVLNQLNGLLIVRMFEDETVSFTEQGELLAKMLTLYLDQAVARQK